MVIIVGLFNVIVGIEQPLNAAAVMILSPVPIVTLFKAVQFRNANVPIEVMPSGRVILVNFAHPLNVLSLIEVIILFVMFILVKLVNDDILGIFAIDGPKIIFFVCELGK